jgi:hypothetical protein
MPFRNQQVSVFFTKLDKEEQPARAFHSPHARTRRLSQISRISTDLIHVAVNFTTTGQTKDPDLTRLKN